MSKNKEINTINPFSNINWSHLQEQVEIKEILDTVIKFHYKTMFRENNEIFNLEDDLDILAWAETVQNRDILPETIEDIINLDVDLHSKIHSFTAFDTELPIDMKVMGNLLYDAYGRESPYSSKRYPSAGALYPIIPLLIVLKTNKNDKRLSPGCYVFDSTKPRLLRITQWDKDDIRKVESLINISTDNLIAPQCIAYALDFRRAITKYHEKGYRHALMEVGLMAQSFRESLQKYNNLGERCWSGFLDAPLTHICGLNIRLCPIVLVQWFGMKVL